VPVEILALYVTCWSCHMLVMWWMTCELRCGDVWGGERTPTPLPYEYC
jgi:hypothetical protein